MKLVIRSNPTSDLHLSVEPTHTILILKQRISVDIHATLDRFYLCYDQEILSEDNTIEDYGLQEGAIIFCVVKPLTDFVLNVTLEDGSTIPINFQITDTVQKIKRKVGEAAYGRRCPLMLFYNTTLLEDSKMMKDYGIVVKSDVKAIRYIS